MVAFSSHAKPNSSQNFNDFRNSIRCLDIIIEHITILSLAKYYILIQFKKFSNV